MKKHGIKMVIMSLLLFGLLMLPVQAQTSYELEIGESAVNFSNGNLAYKLDKPFNQTINTFQAWIKVPTNIADNTRVGIISGNYSVHTVNGVNFEVYTKGRVRVYWNNGQRDVIFETVDVRQNKWLHITIVRDYLGNKFLLFLNGEYQETVNGAGIKETISPYAYVIGFDRTNWRTKYPFKGEISKVSYFSQPRNATQIDNDYKTGDFLSDSDLIASFKLKNNDTLAEESGKNILAKRSDLDTYYDGTVIEGDYSFIILPDTQRMAKLNPDDLIQMSEWIIENKAKYNIKFVIHLGDLTDGGAAYPTQETMFVSAGIAMKMLDGILPYSLVLGNHDYDDELAMSRDTIYFNRTFNYSEYEDLETFGGAYESGKMDNTYHKITIGEHKYLIFALEFGPRDSVLRWANRVANEHPDYQLIYTTHSHISEDGGWMDKDHKGVPTGYPMHTIYGNEVNNADEVWEKFLTKHPKMILTLSGHVITDDIVVKTDVGDYGNSVQQILINGQGVFLSKGEPLLCLLTFTDNGKTINFNYINTKTEQFFNRQNQFSLPIGENINN